jgi:hypothetical protein
MPDILMWLDQKDPSLPRIEEIPQEFEDGLKTVTAVAMQLGHEALTAEKIDLLDIRPLRSSATKKVVLHISPGDHRLRMRDMDNRLKEIALYVRNYFDLPKGSVSAGAAPVAYKCWVKV